MTTADPPFNILTSADATSGLFNYTEGGNVRGGFILTWDGADGDASTLDATGLGGIDLTNSGTLDILAVNLQSDLSFDVTIEVYTDAGNASSYTLAVNGTNMPNTYQAPLTSFTTLLGTGADFTNVGAVRFLVNTSGTVGDLDMQVYDISSTCSTCASTPIAVADKVVTETETAISIDVQDNDSDPSGDILTTSIATPPMNGTAVVVGDDIDYTPNPGFAGTDCFEYTITNTSNVSATAQVCVIVSPCGTPQIVDLFGAASPYTVLINVGSEYNEDVSASVLGGERDVETFMTVADPSFELFTVGDAVSGQFNYIEGGTVRGGFMLVYDGTDGDASTLDPTGLGGIDLTNGGLQDALILNLEVDNDATIEVNVYTNGGAVSTYMVTLLPGNISRDYILPFADFVGGLTSPM